MATRDEGHIAKGAKVRLACDIPDCWIDRIDAVSGGGTPRRAPSCPSCQHPMRPLGDIEPPMIEDWGE